ncbi:oxygen-dependent coproporphyrinogen oxidase [Balneolales bacterium ANBcel1]|nr:oxygen-dependent coproporphyrinogen oxidase [Balneolales bacterium ANBcel1]
MSVKELFTNWLYDTQDRICAALEETDGKETFREDKWIRSGGGGGRTRVIERGGVFEKGGVNVSAVHGALPEPIRKRFGVDSGWFYACGLSLVLHPESPMIPTVHANYRYFELYDQEGGDIRDAWFGGGADLTPYYLFEEDTRHFHLSYKKTCDALDPGLYPRFKESCDHYFYNAHRGEARGVGGIFFDYARADQDHSIDFWLQVATGCGEAFLPSYLPIVERRADEPWGAEERMFQELGRGRYVEFNLIHDRGTLFGLKTGGRIESILMSLPPRVRWDYNPVIREGSRESHLLDVLKAPRNWVD